MERSLDPQEILEHVTRPAFLVQDGIITNANRAALARQIKTGTAVADLIRTGQLEYKEFSNGRLCLTLCLDNIIFHASAVKADTCDIFYLESEFTEPELQVLALAAQQLREPLADALTCTDALMPDTKCRDNPELSYQLQKINRSLYRIHRAICNMSDAAQYSNQRLSRMETNDVSAVIAEIMDKACCFASEAGRTLVYKGPPQAVYCSIDAEKLERALLNMVSNAIKYSSAGSTIHAKLDRTGKRISFSIRNDTDGLSAHTRATLFNSFTREPGLGDSCNGIGLGMTIIRSAAAAHGGALLFDQPSPQELRFTMTLPVHRSTENTVRSPVLLPVDYAGGYDHTLTELADVLPPKLYE